LISVSRCLRLARSVEPGDFVSSSEPFGECLKTMEGENWTAAGYGLGVRGDWRSEFRRRCLGSRKGAARGRVLARVGDQRCIFRPGFRSRSGWFLLFLLRLRRSEHRRRRGDSRLRGSRFSSGNSRIAMPRPAERLVSLRDWTIQPAPVSRRSMFSRARSSGEMGLARKWQ